jgi:hypothetical protein
LELRRDGGYKTPLYNCFCTKLIVADCSDKSCPNIYHSLGRDEHLNPVAENGTGKGHMCSDVVGSCNATNLHHCKKEDKKDEVKKEKEVMKDNNDKKMGKKKKKKKKATTLYDPRGPTHPVSKPKTSLVVEKEETVEYDKLVWDHVVASAEGGFGYMTLFESKMNHKEVTKMTEKKRKKENRKAREDRETRRKEEKTKRDERNASALREAKTAVFISSRSTPSPATWSLTAARRHGRRTVASRASCRPTIAASASSPARACSSAVATSCSTSSSVPVATSSRSTSLRLAATYASAVASSSASSGSQVSILLFMVLVLESVLVSVK